MCSSTTNFTGGAAGQIKITPSSDPTVAKYQVTFDKDTPGLHTIVVQAETPARQAVGEPDLQGRLGRHGPHLADRGPTDHHSGHGQDYRVGSAEGCVGDSDREGALAGRGLRRRR